MRDSTPGASLKERTDDVTCFRKRDLLLGLFAFFCLSVLTARADVSLPALIADHAVLQRGIPIHVWGNANPGEDVSVAFLTESRTVRADDLGRWSVYLPPHEAGGPFELKIKGNNTIILRDVWVGDVWVASGQSNMEFGLAGADRAEAEIAAARHPGIRLLLVDRNTSDYPLTDVVSKDSWQPCTPESARNFSAVAYFFGREVHEDQNVPVGLIESAWGGTPAESWTSLDALASDASLMPVFAQRAVVADAQAEMLLRLQKEEREYKAAVARAEAEGKPTPFRRWHPDFGAWQPAALYNAMIAPLTPFPIRGVIWYQGESNTPPEKAPLYARLFQTMIRDWRHAWGQGDFPFLFVQIANWNSTDLWPEVREAQRQTLALRKTGMAVTIDIGDPVNIHPTDKQDVGHRLALAARAIAYAEDVEYSGPALRQVTLEPGSLRVWFDHVTGGLQAKGGELKGFEVAGVKGEFSPAEARIEGSTVLVSSPAVEHPRYVRYAWASNPECNLYNGAGLPASPFRASAPE